MSDIQFKMLGYTFLTVSSSVVDFTDCDDSGVLIAKKGLRVVEFQVDPAGGNVRMTKDGSTDPVGATTGVRLDAGDIVELTAVEARNAKFLYDDGATDGTLQCHFYGTD